jgi:hypothetical protein
LAHFVKPYLGGWLVEVLPVAFFLRVLTAGGR